MRKYLLIFVALIILFQSTTKVNAQIDPVLAIQLQDVIDNSVLSAGNNGVSACVIMPDGQTWTGSAGVGTGDVPITDTTVFHGASITKMNVAVLMLILAQEGLIDLDDSWSDYVSLDANFDPAITIRHLLNHTSGIADYLETATSGNDVTSDFNFFYTPQYILENVVDDTPWFSVGTDFEYSNSNYALAALIAESVTGNPVNVELRNRIWNPLEMNHTYFGAYDSYTEPTAGVWWNFGSGLTNYSDMPTTSLLSYAYGAGNIVTCPNDLAIFLTSILNGQLLSPESLVEMLTFVPGSSSSWTAGYGLGIHHANVPGDDIVLGHDGYYSNLTSMFGSTEYEFTVVTMTNTQTSWFGIFDPMYDVLTDYFLSTNVNEIINKFELSIYPNPSKNKFEISCEFMIDEIEIRDLLGKTVYNSKPQANNISVTLEIDGVYFVTIKSNNKTATRSLVVSN